MRTAKVTRTTKETDISLSLSLDGTGKAQISTGVGFFDHMLELLTVHSRMDVTLTCKGDLQVDAHHTVEDVGIALGDCVKTALGDKRGIARFADRLVPMDEVAAQVAIDFSGRPCLISRIRLREKWAISIWNSWKSFCGRSQRTRGATCMCTFFAWVTDTTWRRRFSRRSRCACAMR